MSSQVLSNQPSLGPLDAWVRLLRGHAAATRELSARLVAEHGLTINDYECLLHLSRAEQRALRRVDLAELLILTPSGVTRLLDGLERRGYVGRDDCSTDRRVSYAVLTKEGRDKLREASKSHTRQIRELLGTHYDDDELARLVVMLDRLPGATPADESCEPDS